MPAPSLPRVSAEQLAGLSDRTGKGATWWNVASMRSLLGSGDWRVVAHFHGPDPKNPRFSFLGALLTGHQSKPVRSVVVLLEHSVVLLFDAAGGSTMVVEPDSRFVLQALSSPASTALTAIRFADGIIEAVPGFDFAGAQVGNWVVLFHADSTPARSAVSFDIAGEGERRLLITGLAGGPWEVWRDGWLERHDLRVDSRAGALYFEGPAGGYFLRRL